MKTAIITGAGAGVGRATAQALLEKGYHVALIGRRMAPLEETAAGFDNTLVLSCDVSDAEAVEAAFNKVYEAWGQLDVLFNNAGISLPGKTIDEVAVEDWLSMVNINLTGSFLCARQAFTIMRKQSPQGGRIINNGSISAHMPRPGSAPYTTTKHAISGLTRTLSLDGRPFNIACGQIDIGNAATDMTEKMSVGMPQADGSVKAEPTMDVRHIANSVVHMAELPLDANIQFMTVMATTMPYIGRG